MVYIITGPINSGKTSHLLSLYDAIGRGDGICSRKTRDDQGVILGYDLVHLASRRSVPFICLKTKTPQDWSEAFQYDKFSFSTTGMDFAEAIVEQIVRRAIEPIFIDEIGAVELTGQGFDRILRGSLQTQRTLYITVRDIYADQVIRKYNIHEPTVI